MQDSGEKQRSLLLHGRVRSARFSPPKTMKPKIHPEYTDAVIHCACGTVFQTRSTRKDMRIGICSKCHPFFTGTQKYVDTAGRVERFQKRYAASTAAAAAAAAATEKKKKK